MKTIKITIMLSFLLFSIQGFSQNKTPQERASRQLKMFTKACNLTSDQQPKVEQILLNSNLKIDAVKEEQPNQKGERLQQLKAIAVKQDEDMKVVLTPEQFQKYLDVREKIKEKAKEKNIEKKQQQQNNIAIERAPLTSAEKAEKQLNGINKVCNLTKEQLPKVEQILINTNSKLEEVKTIKPTYKGERIDKIKAITDDEDTQLKAVLTPEQFQKYIDMKAARKEKLKEKIQNR